MEKVSLSELEALGRLQTCAVANAIEGFNIRPRNEGFMLPKVKAIFPDMGNMVGYAVTAVIAADSPASANMNYSRTNWVDEILKIPEPRVIVIKDLDYPNVIGSFWGEVQSNMHKSLGCVGTVTDGGVRDLDEMKELGFFAFATEVLVSHAYVHLVEANVPVRIGGVRVDPGDILLGDKHGVISVPGRIVPDLPAAVADVEVSEKEIIDLCQAVDFTPEKLKNLLGQRYG